MPDAGSISAIIALVLSVPGAILAVKDIIERIRKKTKVELIVKKLDHVKNIDSKIYIVNKDGIKIELENANAKDVIESLGSNQEVKDGN